METDFKVKIGDFEGPLDLLLDMIERRKLHISDVSLSQVADDFIEHIKDEAEFKMSDSAEFILIASTLLLIKSKSLLPNLELTAEEEQSIEELEDRLRLYTTYRDLSDQIKKIFGNFEYFANERKTKLKIFAPTSEITQASILQSIQEVLQKVPKTAPLPKVTVEKMMSLEEMISNLTLRITSSIKTSFREFAERTNGAGQKEKADKVFVIVAFLAMLELVKQGAVRVSQEKNFDDIEIESENISTPTYN